MDAQQLQAVAPTLTPTPELIVVSPLRRAVDTALLGFAHIFSDPSARDAIPLGRGDLHSSIPILGNELARENYGRSERTPAHTPEPSGNICDKRRPLSDIKADYPYIDWALVNDGPVDLVYQRGGETFESFVERGYNFMLWLAAREESTIVVACHSGFLLNVANCNINAIRFLELSIESAEILENFP